MPENTRESEPSTHVSMLAALARMGASRALIGAIAGLDTRFSLSTADRRYLEGPIVVHEAGGWHKGLPRWIYDLVGAERIRIIYGTAPAGMVVSPAELSLVMHDAMMSAPRGADTTDLYLWASSHAAADHQLRPVDAVWATLGGEKVTDGPPHHSRAAHTSAYRACPN